MSVALVGTAVSAVGVISNINSANKAAKNASKQIDAQTELAMEQLKESTRQADELLSFNKQVYEEGKLRQVGIDEVNKKVTESNLALSEKAGARADETYDFYKSTGRPVIEKALSDAQNYDSEGNIQAARGRATADVAQGFSNAESQSQRALTRLGISPSAGRFVALQQRLHAEKAGALAGAATNAEQGIRDQAIGLRQQGANIAGGLPAQSLAQGNQSSGTGVAAAGVAGASAAQHAALANSAMNGVQAGADIYRGAAGGYSNLAGQSQNALNAIQANANGQMAGWGNLMGQFLPKLSFANLGGQNVGNVGAEAGGWPYADGGHVVGPGTGTSDSIPARLSNGEYVIPADVVKKKGTEFFEKLLEKNHKPVNLGAGR